MTDTEPKGAAQPSLCMEPAVPVSTTKKKSNKIPKELSSVEPPPEAKAPVVESKTLEKAPKTTNHTVQLARRSDQPSGKENSRRSRRSGYAKHVPQMVSRVGDDMKIVLASSAASDEHKTRVDRCFQRLQATIAELGPRWRLEVFGSVASGFSTSTSDMDATCVRLPPAEGEEDERVPDAKTVLMDRLVPLIRDKLEFEIVEKIPFAKVPILRLRFQQCLEIDLSCGNDAALRNTRLLRAYAHLDPRVRELGVAVKLWARAASIVGASQSRLSSYTFTLLTIYFMQVHRDVKLPVLSPGLFENDANPAKAETAMATASSEWTCRLELPDLFLRFVGFYTMEFDWGREVVCPRLGQRRNSTDGVFDKLRGRHVPRIHVEDPFSLERNLHCVLGDTEEVQLREAFQTAWHTLYSGGTPVGLHPSGQTMELHLSELTSTTPNTDWLQKASPQSSPELGPSSPPGGIDFMKAFGAIKTAPGPPGVFSSSGSTESGDASGAHMELSNSGESNDEWSGVASSARPRVLSVEQLENTMVQKQDIKAGLPWTQQWNAQPSDQANQWWLNLGGNGMAQANNPDQRKSLLNVHTLADVERKMTGMSESSCTSEGFNISSLFGNKFAVGATSKIATRISGGTFGQQQAVPVQ